MPAVSGQQEKLLEERAVFNGFENNTKVPKPTNISCYQCVDDKYNEKNKFKEDVKTCAEFRDLWRKFMKAKKGVGSRPDYGQELLHMLKTQFGRKCPYGTEDCFYTRAFDVRVVGFEARGCGSGPSSVDAEPGEKCQQEAQMFEGEEVPVINCVCEDKVGNKKGYCNKAATLYGTGTTLASLGTAAATLLLWQFLE